MFDCGFQPRSALEVDDSSQVRIDKIFKVIEACKFGIHDISRTEADTRTRLPRFNVPFEVGLFLGAKRYGQGKQKKKMCLILDREPNRYQAFISDIAGQDLRAHKREPERAIGIVRDWLRSLRPLVSIPGGNAVVSRYESFRRDLPEMCRQVRLAVDDLTYPDYTWCVSSWLSTSLDPGVIPGH